MSASQPGKRTVRTGPEGAVVRETGRSPKRERRWRSVRITERSLRARAKSMDKLSRRPRVLRVVVESWPEVEKQGERAVMVGLSLKLRFVPFEVGLSHFW